MPQKGLKEALDKHLREIHTMREAGTRRGDIVAWLNQQGIPCTAYDLKLFFERTGSVWAAQKSLDKSALVDKSTSEPVADDRPLTDRDVKILMRRVERLATKLLTAAENDPKIVPMADRLVRTLINYQQYRKSAALKLLEHRRKKAKDRQSSQTRPKSNHQNTAESADQDSEPDFDNTEKIRRLRAAAFADVEALKASGTLIIPGLDDNG